MMSRLAWLALVALAGCASAHAEEYVRGEFRFSTGPAPAFAKFESIEAAWPASAPGADDSRWRFWLWDYQVDFRNGGEHAFVDYVYEPRSATLLGEAGRFQIDFLPQSQSLTLHHLEVRRDGRWESRLDPARVSLARREERFDQDLADGAVTALLLIDDVRVGDAVRISYSIRGGNPMLAGQRTTWMRGGFSSPVLETRSRALYDPGTPVESRAWLTKAQPAVRNGADAVEVEYAARAVGATLDHGDYPRGYGPREALHVGPRRSWGEVARWAAPMYPKVDAPLPSDLETRVAAWKALPQPAARLREALRAVQDDVRYFGIEMGENTHRPHPPSETWTRRFGDCKDKAYLLVTLLGRLGIDAAPALVSTEEGKHLADQLASGDAFDHVIVRARLDGRDVWLDPTISQQGGDPETLDLSDLGYALPLSPGSDRLVAIRKPANDPTGVEVHERWRTGADGRAELEVTTTHRGWSADRARRELAAERTEDLARRYENFYRKRFERIEAVRPPERRDDRDANVYRVIESYRVPGAFEGTANGDHIDLFAEALQEPTTPPAAPDHPGPLRVSFLGRYVHVVEVTVPDGWSPRFAESRYVRKSPAFDYLQQVSIDGSTTTVRQEYTATRRDLDAAATREHIAALGDVREGLDVRLQYVRPSSMKKGEREERLKNLLRDAMKE